MHLPGSVSGAELEAYFRAADVFVMASDHEGFCVPLAEAMGHGVPIVAYGVTAVPETVGGAGLVLDDKSAVPFAAAVGRVLRDDTLRGVLAAAGRERAAGFDLAASTRPLRRAGAAGRRAEPRSETERRPRPDVGLQAPSAVTRSTARAAAVGRSRAAIRRPPPRPRAARRSPSPSTRATAAASA